MCTWTFIPTWNFSIYVNWLLSFYHVIQQDIGSEHNFVLWFVIIRIEITKSTICRLKVYGSYLKPLLTTDMNILFENWLKQFIKTFCMALIEYINKYLCVGGTILFAIACCKIAISRIIKLQLVNLNACIFSEAWRPCRIFTLKVLGMHSSRRTWCWYEQLYLQF